MRKGQPSGQLKREVEATKKRLASAKDETTKLPTFAAPTPEGEAATSSGGGIGLLTVEEFKAKREAMMLDAAAKKKKEAAIKRKESKRKKLAAKARMSFQDEEDEEDEGEEGPEKKAKRMQLGKDPTVETSFLPDRERDEEEERLRRELAGRWAAEQEAVKEEQMVVTFSFWDGKGTRRAHRIRKGATVGEFLGEVKQTIEEIRGVATSSLILVKEDMIIPQHFTFYELITTRARAANGAPLFRFDVQEDIRLLQGSSVEKQER